MIQISENGLNLIREFEGLRLNAYLDSAGIPTIGFGTTRYEDGSRVKIGDKITKQKAFHLLSRHLDNEVIPVIAVNVKSALQQHQIDALASLIYNIGAGNFRTSSVLKKINDNAGLKEIKNSWIMWNKAKGKVLPGLVRRRAAEFKMFSA